MNQTLETINSLRSIHGQFSAKDVPDDALKAVLKAAVRTANASARQSYSILVVEDREVIRKELQYPGSKALIFCVDFNRIFDTAEHIGEKPPKDGLMAFITGGTDAVLAAQTAVIAAKSLGIDSLLTNVVHRVDPDKLFETFNMPVHYCFPMIALILGYPETEPDHQRGRLQGEGVIHFGRYSRVDEAGLDRIVAAYDDPAAHLAMNPGWKEQGFPHYLNWFYEKWCGDGSDRIEEQKRIFNFLRKSGFVDERLWKD